MWIRSQELNMAVQQIRKDRWDCLGSITTKHPMLIKLEILPTKCIMTLQLFRHIHIETSASALHEATAYSCQFWILLGSKRMWLGHKFVPNNVLHLFLSSRRHDRNSDVKSLNNIKPIQIIFIIIIYMFTNFCDRLKPSKNYLDIFISVEYCLPYWRQMNSIHN